MEIVLLNLSFGALLVCWGSMSLSFMVITVHLYEVVKWKLFSLIIEGGYYMGVEHVLGPLKTG